MSATNSRRAALQRQSMQGFLRCELERIASRLSIDAWLRGVRSRMSRAERNQTKGRRVDEYPHLLAQHNLHASGCRPARLLGRFDHHRDKPCAGVRRRTISTPAPEQHTGVNTVATRHRRGRIPAPVALRDDAPLLRLVPPPSGRIRLARPRLLPSLRHLRSCSLDWRAPLRCPIPIAHVRSIPPIREGGTHRMHTLQTLQSQPQAFGDDDRVGERVPASATWPRTQWGVRLPEDARRSTTPT